MSMTELQNIQSCSFVHFLGAIGSMNLPGGKLGLMKYQRIQWTKDGKNQPETQEFNTAKKINNMFLPFILGT